MQIKTLRGMSGVISARLSNPPERARNQLQARQNMNLIRSICVYCGSADGRDPRHLAAARDLGQAMAAAGIGLVYGGGNSGLMGEVARAVLASGGHVTGVIPEFLQIRELMLEGAQSMTVVPDMHTRKQMMFDRADAFVALPGGIGTLEELFEQMTWGQLGRHHKPVLVADIGGYWQPLLALLAHVQTEGFVRASLRPHFIVADSVDQIIPMLQAASSLLNDKLRDRA